MEERIDITPNESDERHLRGWLVLFLICAAIGGVLTIFSNLYYTEISHDYQGHGWISAAVLLGLLGHSCVCFYVIEGFYRKRENAVFWGKVMLISYMASNIVIILQNNYPYKWIHSIWSCMMALILGVIWYVYLCRSKQVERIIPHEKRSPSRKDWIALVSLISVPLLCMCIGLVKAKQDLATREAEPFIVQRDHNSYEFRHCVVSLPSKYNSRIQGEGKEAMIEFEDKYGNSTGYIVEDVLYPYHSVKDIVDKTLIPEIKTEIQHRNLYISNIRTDNEEGIYSTSFTASTYMFGGGDCLYYTIASKQIGPRHYVAVLYVSQSQSHSNSIIYTPVGIILDLISIKK